MKHPSAVFIDVDEAGRAWRTNTATGECVELRCALRPPVMTRETAEQKGSSSAAVLAWVHEMRRQAGVGQVDGRQPSVVAVESTSAARARLARLGLA